MNERVLVCFQERHVGEIQHLIIDEDAEGALEFLRSVVLPQLGENRRQTLGTRRKERGDGKLPGQRRDNLPEA